MAAPSCESAHDRGFLLRLALPPPSDRAAETRPVSAHQLAVMVAASQATSWLRHGETKEATA